MGVRRVAVLISAKKRHQHRIELHWRAAWLLEVLYWQSILMPCCAVPYCAVHIVTVSSYLFASIPPQTFALPVIFSGVNNHCTVFHQSLKRSEAENDERCTHSKYSIHISYSTVVHYMLHYSASSALCY